MLEWAVNKVAGILKPTPTQPEGIHRDIFGRVVERGDEFFHPKKFRGIPVFDVDSIYRHYQPQMDKIRTHFDIGMQRKTPQGESLYKVIVEDIVKRYIEFCHMIPASEDHHHANTGGLLLHSLEASVESLRWAKEKDPRVTEYVDINAQVKPVMIYCAWLAALLHDAGKLMRDISVDAVEILNGKNQLITPSEPIVSWHPARESLIEWAKQHRVASYSVNFLRGRVHRRHNIDSSQILQPLLRGQYAMEYLLSTPIKQQVYNDITRVLSGYTTNDDFLSESVRMGDAASTSRSLGFFYDTRLGNRAVSTAQRLFKSIQSAAREWEWNRADGQGWVIANDVYIRWTSSIENIQKVSMELGYSLPTDVKNILNIMDSNLITDLFDRSFPDDRIVRFTPGKYHKDSLQEIRDGKTVPIWHHLLKLRGPQIIFSESPMPFNQPGIVYLPQSDRYYLIDNDGETLSVLSAAVALPSEATVAATTAAVHDSAPTPQESEPTLPNAQVFELPAVKPGKAKQSSGLNGVKFKNAPADKKDNQSKDEKTTEPKNEAKSKVDKQMPEKKASESASCTKDHGQTKSPTKKSKLSSVLSLAQEKGITVFCEEEHVLLSLEDLEKHTELSSRTLLSQLEKASEMYVDMSRPNRKTWTFTDAKGVKHKCVKLTVQASKHFQHGQALVEPVPEPISSSRCSSANSVDAPIAPPPQEVEKQQTELFGEEESYDAVHSMLMDELDNDTLVHYLHNCGELHTITSDAHGNALFDHKLMSPAAKRVLNITRIRNYMRERGFELTDNGYRLTVEQMRNILLHEVNKDG